MPVRALQGTARHGAYLVRQRETAIVITAGMAPSPGRSDPRALKRPGTAVPDSAILLSPGNMSRAFPSRYGEWLVPFPCGFPAHLRPSWRTSMNLLKEETLRRSA